MIRLPPPRTTRKQAHSGERQQKHGIGREVRIGRSHLWRRRFLCGEPGAKRVSCPRYRRTRSARWWRPRGEGIPSSFYTVATTTSSAVRGGSLSSSASATSATLMIFNAVVIADCARRLWKFGVRTPMPTPTPTTRPMRRLRLVDRWRGSDEELIRLFNGEGRPDGAPRPRQMSLEEVKRHRLSLPGGDRLGVSRRRPAARVAGDS